MDGEHRKHSNDSGTENLERPARGPRRRTRDSGALPDLNDSRKKRVAETISRRRANHPRSPKR